MSKDNKTILLATFIPLGMLLIIALAALYKFKYANYANSSNDEVETNSMASLPSLKVNDENNNSINSHIDIDDIENDRLSSDIENDDLAINSINNELQIFQNDQLPIEEKSYPKNLSVHKLKIHTNVINKDDKKDDDERDTPKSVKKYVDDQTRRVISRPENSSYASSPVSFLKPADISNNPLVPPAPVAESSAHLDLVRR